MAYTPGARASKRNGPPPDPNSLRSAKRGAEWVRIPASARDNKDAPEWPHYLSKPSMQELALWVELWKKPQAVLWLRDGVVNEVAMYVRTYISSMEPGGFVTEKSAAERMAGTLLLTVPALLAAKVLIVDESESDEIAEDGRSGEIKPIGSVRNRFTVVTPASDDVEDDENESSTSDDRE